MPTTHFHLRFLVNQSAEVVFNSVTNVRGWWSETLVGASENLHDEFEYRHGEFHYSKHKLIEVIPNKKLVWLTLESHISFVQKHDEWTGTKVIFEIAAQGDQTSLNITHFGLTPEVACYENCVRGWKHYLQHSLLPLITNGKGKPDAATKD